MTHPAQMTDPAQIREFVLAGNARLTLVSRKTGARFTYRVRAAKGDGPASHFVSVLTGPENNTDYGYLGFFRCSDGRCEYVHGYTTSRRAHVTRNALTRRRLEQKRHKASGTV